MVKRIPVNSGANSGDDLAPAMALLGHDLRAAVSDIIGGLRLMDPDRLDPAMRMQFDRVRAAAEVVARLVEEGLGELAGEAVDRAGASGILRLAELLDDIRLRTRGHAREKGLDFVLDAAGDLPEFIAVERIALERMLSNVLSNAIKYTARGGISLRVLRDGVGALLFRIRDDGPGFSANAFGHLFQFGHRGVAGDGTMGSGMGLHITKEMADRIGATISIVNAEGGGAEVTLRLPANAWAPSGTESAQRAAGLPDLSRHHVLVAEDSATNQALIGRMLSMLGARHTMAGDGVAAMAALEREAFDMALIDIEMPRISGIEVIRAIRAGGDGRAHMPVMAVTAYVLRANREAIYAAGADAILAKPLGSLEGFGQAVARLLERTGDDPPGGPAGDAAADPSTGDDIEDETGDGTEDAIARGVDKDMPEHTDRVKEASVRGGGAGRRGAGAGPVRLDAARFDKLLEIAGPGGGGELLARLHSDLHDVERGLVKGLAEPDSAAIRTHTHVLIAVAGAVGAERLSGYARRLNTAAHRRDHQNMARLGRETLHLLDDLIHFISSRRETSRDPR